MAAAAAAAATDAAAAAAAADAVAAAAAAAADYTELDALSPYQLAVGEPTRPYTRNRRR